MATLPGGARRGHLASRHFRAVPTRARSAFERRLLETALPSEDDVNDPLYLAALALEHDRQLSGEIADCGEEAAIGDGLADRAGGLASGRGRGAGGPRAVNARLAESLPVRDADVAWKAHPIEGAAELFGYGAAKTDPATSEPAIKMPCERHIGALSCSSHSCVDGPVDVAMRKPPNCRYDLGGNHAAIKECSVMPNRRFVLGLLASTPAFALGGVAFAKGPHRHHNGHDLLGAKLKQNGKHEVGKVGKETVIAEVNNGKVTAMSAGSHPVSKVKTNKKMAQSGSGNVHLAAFGDMQLAQAGDWYYGYCIDWGDYVDCYWYLASDVIVTDGWVEYIPV